MGISYRNAALPSGQTPVRGGKQLFMLTIPGGIIH
jgi:hypothetical protein